MAAHRILGRPNANQQRYQTTTKMMNSPLESSEKGNNEDSNVMRSEPNNIDKEEKQDEDEVVVVVEKKEDEGDAVRPKLDSDPLISSSSPSSSDDEDEGSLSSSLVALVMSNSKNNSNNDLSRNNDSSEPKDDDERGGDTSTDEGTTKERQLFRKKRRRLYRMLKGPQSVPSFMAVLQRAEVITIDDDDDDNYQNKNESEEDKNVPVPPVIIDVDEYLGLKQPTLLPPMTTSSSSFPPSSSSVPTPSAVGSSSANTIPSRVSSSNRFMKTTTTTTTPTRKKRTLQQPPQTVTVPTTTTMTPAEEGWYEGRKGMSIMPEDAIYLSGLQQWIRQQLEFFSATDADVATSQAGRRTPTTLGKVGVRCIHCAKHILPKLANNGSGRSGEQGGGGVSWPPGAVSYPLSVSGLYSNVSQKAQLHFEHCPHLPQSARFQPSPSPSSHLASPDAPFANKKRKRMVQGISALMYYTIACQRIGIVETSKGLRFSRDLSLEPLSFESVKLKIEQEQPHLIPRQYQNNSNSIDSRPDRVASSSTAKPKAPPIEITDQNCREVLQQAFQEPEEPSTRLVRKTDRQLVTDYMFLILCQMSICHASQRDFLGRGKKTKLMRLGFAGFSCRHCSSSIHAPGQDARYMGHMYSCRSFSSAPDNLASAISNSFVLHLQRCPYTPQPIQSALSVLKKYHARQMSQLPYGSQRRLFFEMWERLRAADLTIEQAKELQQLEEEKVRMATAAAAEAAANNESSTGSGNPSDGGVATTITPLVVGSSTLLTAAPADTASLPHPYGTFTRGANFPVSNDEETTQVLKDAEENWDATWNDKNLILPQDRNLVSDYVFLTMRQLRVAIPEPGDFRGNRRNNVLGRMAGMCCIHCAGTPPVFATPSGRSFPSAPDNMASALNTSLYNHMQNCPHVPSKLKRAFQHTRRLHSAQCSRLQFGAQRRFFNKVFDKLKTIIIPKNIGGGGSPRDQQPILNEEVFRAHFFGKVYDNDGSGNTLWQCKRCRMTPLEFRAPNAVLCIPLTSMTATIGRKPILVREQLKQHQSVCQKDAVYVPTAKQLLKELNSKYTTSDETLFEKESFRTLVRSVVGDDEDMIRIFSMADEEQPLSSSLVTARMMMDHRVDQEKVQDAFAKLSKEFPKASGVAAAAADNSVGATLQSDRLIDHPLWVRYLELISPYFICPLGLPVEDGKKENPNTHATTTTDDEEGQAASSAEDVKIGAAEGVPVEDKKEENPNTHATTTTDDEVGQAASSAGDAKIGAAEDDSRPPSTEDEPAEQEQEEMSTSSEDELNQPGQRGFITRVRLY